MYIVHMYIYYSMSNPNRLDVYMCVCFCVGPVECGTGYTASVNASDVHVGACLIYMQLRHCAGATVNYVRCTYDVQTYR